MYVSARHICFHSTVISKQMKVVISLTDIDEIRRSQHALINPAITIVLRTGVGGHGTPPSRSLDGRVRYKFASFWNRNHALRALQRTIKHVHDVSEAVKKEKEESALSAHSRSNECGSKNAKILEDSTCTSEKSQPFIKEEVLVGIYKDVFPCTAEMFFDLLLKDNSTFTYEYRAVRRDTDLVIGQWHGADEFDGQIRELTLRTLCNNPMCPPDTAMTERQHVVLSMDKKKLVFETVQQLHDVPFASFFEIHCKWCLETISESSCALDIKVGAFLKKWCMVQSKIKSGVIIEVSIQYILFNPCPLPILFENFLSQIVIVLINDVMPQYKKEVDVMLEVGRSYVTREASNDESKHSMATASLDAMCK